MRANPLRGLDQVAGTAAEHDRPPALVVLDGVDVELAHLPDPQGHLIQDDDGNVLAAGRGAEGARLVTMSVWGVR